MCLTIVDLCQVFGRFGFPLQSQSTTLWMPELIPGIVLHSLSTVALCLLNWQDASKTSFPIKGLNPPLPSHFFPSSAKWPKPKKNGRLLLFY